MEDDNMPRYLVEGAYSGGNDGRPITGDYVVAANENEAKTKVTEVREATDEWNCERAITVEDYIIELQERIDRLACMTEEEVEDGWAETVENLGGEDEDEDEDDGGC